jgi:hypothetical protein
VRHAGHAVRQLGCGRRRHPHKVGGEGDLAHLFSGDFGQFLVAVADVDIPQPGHAVEHGAAVGGVQPDALRAVDDERVGVLLGMVQRVKLPFVVFDHGGVVENHF